jgi:hypothetical protein
MINPGYASGGFPWKQVVLKGNTWTFPGAPQYEFVTTSGLGWNLVTLDNLNWQGDVCNGCTHSDINHGEVNLSSTTLIEPYGPTVYVTGNTSPITASIDARKQEDGSQIQIVNAGSSPVSFTSDNNLSLNGTVTLAGGSNSSMTFLYSAALGKFKLSGGGTSSISATGGTPQSTTVNTVFAKALQATVVDANNNPLSGVPVTFSAPSSGAGATFSGSSTASVVTGANGIATAPSVTANSQIGSYSITATATGIATSAVFSLTNSAATTAPVGGSLIGSGNSSTGAVNLTSQGSVDWEHWGEATINRKAGVTQQLSTYKVVGAGAVYTYNNDPRTVNWTDGTPLANRRPLERWSCKSAAG